MVRPDNEVPVVWHKYVAQQPHAGALPGLAQYFLKRGVIASLVENRRPPNAPVEDVVDVTSIGTSCASRHSGMVTIPPQLVNRNET